MKIKLLKKLRKSARNDLRIEVSIFGVFGLNTYESNIFEFPDMKSAEEAGAYLRNLHRSFILTHVWHIRKKYSSPKNDLRCNLIELYQWKYQLFIMLGISKRRTIRRL